LRAAQSELHRCVRPECPEFIRTDCARWLSDVDSALPSIVVAATANGAEVADVTVKFDAEVLTTHLDGKAVLVDPGLHRLTFERNGEKPLTVEVTIREGEKNRPIHVQFERGIPALPPARPAPVETQRSYGVLPHVLLGVGALGVGGFAALALIGDGERRDLEEKCAPRCGDAPVDAVHTKYILADASLAIGVLALAGSGYLFWASGRSNASSSSSSNAARGIEAGLTLTPRAGAGVARWRF
jgi:hypothetical protein